MNSLASHLDSSTVGVALFDRELDCKAVNAALSRMVAVTTSDCAGKTIHEIFCKGALELETIFQRVWESGNPFTNFPLTGTFSETSENACWLVSLFPIKDKSGQVRLLAATFSEVTKRSCVELRLSRLKHKFPVDVSGQLGPFGEEFTYLSARTFNLIKQSVELLKCSMSLRCHLSEARIRKGLMRQALSLIGSRLQKPGLRPLWPRGAHRASPSMGSVPTTGSELPAGCPSPRESQVLSLLADGKSNKEIGTVLEISTRTVEFYRARIMIKLDLHSTAALVRYAIRNNIVEA